MRRNNMPISNPRPTERRSFLTGMSSHQKSIGNHLRQISSMMNAPSRPYITRNPVQLNIRVQRQGVSESESDDDYLDDEIYNDSSSLSSSSQDELIQLTTEDKKQMGVSLQRISHLSTIKITKNIIKSIGSEQKSNEIKKEEKQRQLGSCCAICLQNWVEDDEVTLIPCLHRFHFECLKDWLVQRNRCPCCNALVLE